jgi:hypothetical protein
MLGGRWAQRPRTERFFPTPILAGSAVHVFYLAILVSCLRHSNWHCLAVVSQQSLLTSRYAHRHYARGHPAGDWSLAGFLAFLFWETITDGRPDAYCRRSQRAAIAYRANAIRHGVVLRITDPRVGGSVGAKPLVGECPLHFVAVRLSNGGQCGS